MGLRRRISLVTFLLFFFFIFMLLTLWGQLFLKNKNLVNYISSDKVIGARIRTNSSNEIDINKYNNNGETVTKRIKPLSAERVNLQKNNGETVTKRIKHSAERVNLTSEDTESTVKQSNDYFMEGYPVKKEPVASWINEQNSGGICEQKVTIFGGRFAVGHGVVMSPTRRLNYEKVAKGGEEVRQVLNQRGNMEDYQFNSDFWEVPCSQVGSSLRNTQQFYWLKNIKIVENKIDMNAMKNVSKYTIGIRRQDYANLHNWVRNIYNTFLTMMHLNIPPSKVSILFLDGHPFTYLDNAWEAIYTKPIRVGQLNQSIYYENFVWGFQEGKGPVSEQKDSQPVPYLEEFRSFVLSRFKLNHEDKLDCKNLRITFILRRNAVYHPRNIEGKVGRKIFNEAEIMDKLINIFPTATIRSVLMESLPMKSQLEISSTTDIWIGMHGAGMSHTIFLPKHAAILELFSLGFKHGRPWFICFHSVTEWRGMKYDSWENLDKTLEMPHDFTIVPPEIIGNKTLNLAKQICPNL